MNPTQSPIIAASMHIASALITLSVLIVLSGIIAFVVARQYGGRDKRKQQLIFLLVGALGLITSALFTFSRLQAT